MNELIEIKKIDNNIFGVSTKEFYLIGLYEKINKNTSKVNLFSWYDKKTKWFNYIIEKYYKEA